MQLPKETEEFINEEARLVTERYAETIDKKELMLAAWNYLRLVHNYGFREAILTDKYLRYPNEISKSYNCFEAGVHSFLLLRKLGLNPKMRLLENTNTIVDDDTSILGDHALVEVLLKGKKFVFDTTCNRFEIVKKEENNTITFLHDVDYKLEYKTSQYYSLDDIINKMNYVKNTTEGKISVIEQEYRLEGFHNLGNLATGGFFISYDKKNNVLNSKQNFRYNWFTSKEVLLEEKLDSKGNITKKDVTLSISKDEFKTKNKICTISKELLDKIYYSLNVFMKDSSIDIYAKSIRLTFNEDVHKLSVNSGTREETLTKLSNELDTKLKEEFNEYRKNDASVMNALKREYYLIKKQELDKKNYQTFYSRNDIDKMFIRLINKNRQDSKDLEDILYDFTIDKLMQNWYGKEKLKRLNEFSIETGKMKRFIDSFFSLRNGPKKETYYLLLDSYFFANKEMPKNDKEILNEVVVKNEGCGYLGFKGLFADCLCHYAIAKKIIDGKIYKDHLIPLIKNYLSEKT